MARFTIDLSTIRDSQDLAQLIGVPEALVRAKLDDNDTLFEKHRIRKRNGDGYREFLEVANEHLSDALKGLDKRIAAFFEDKIAGFPHERCHGYVKDKSIFTNAQIHLRSRVLVRADIANFFPSITVGRVTSLFQSSNLPTRTAELFAKFLTYNGRLPLGFCTSPVIANAVAHPLDADLDAMAHRFEYRYSRYSDDLTFSGSGTPPARIDVSSVLEKHNFQLNRKKFRSKISGQAFYVTGLSVSDPGRPRAARGFKRALRQELHYAEKFGLHDHLGRKDYASYQSGINKIDGRIHFLNSVEPVLAKVLSDRWLCILREAGEEPIHVARREVAPRDTSLFFDESIIETPAGKVFFLGCVVTQDTDAVRDQLRDALGTVLADPYATGAKATLLKKGLHWVDVSEDTRSGVVKAIAMMPVRAYVSYCKYGASTPFDEVYRTLLVPMLRPRFIALDGCNLTISIERHSSLNQSDLQKLVNDLYASLERRNGRRPRVCPQINLASKLDEPCLSLADFALGVLGQYALVESVPTQSGRKTQPGELATTRFERLRAKYRLIRSEDSQKIFTRRLAFKPWPKGEAI